MEEAKFSFAYLQLIMLVCNPTSQISNPKL